MASPGSADAASEDAPAPQVAVVTMVRDESMMLPRWVDYYARQVGPQNLIVLDDHTVDGSTKDLPCTSITLPPTTGRPPFDKTRVTLINGMTRGLLAYFDVVIYTDVDEFIVPDPARHGGLLDYLSKRSGHKAVAPLGLNVLHDLRTEPDLDPTRPVLAQRDFVKFAPGMCKPIVKTAPAPWLPGFHAVRTAYEIDPELWMFHLKFHDMAHLRWSADHRNVLHTTEGRGSVRSAWALDAEELTALLSSWVGTPGRDEVPEVEPAELDLETIVRRTDNGFFHSDGRQLQAMAENPLRRVPERFRQSF